MNTQLIPVFNGSISNETSLLCDARELHSFLSVGKVFAAWIKARIEEYGFTENQDFIIISNSGKNTGRGRKTIDYHLTLDTAKELAMVERNEKGRQIRRYFIECEKQLRHKFAQPSAPTYPPFSDDYPNRTEIIYYQDYRPIFSRILQSNEIVSSPESMMEWLEMRGLMIFTREELKKMTVQQLLAVAG